jgi:hypothetical protein
VSRFFIASGIWNPQKNASLRQLPPSLDRPKSREVDGRIWVLLDLATACLAQELVLLGVQIEMVAVVTNARGVDAS